MELLTSIESIVRWWKEYFEDLLNPTNTHSKEETKLEDFGLDSPITGAEVAGAVKQLHGGIAPGVNEICPELLKALDVVGLSLLTCLCNIVWLSGTVPLEWPTGVVVPLFKKGETEAVFQLQGDHTSKPPQEGLLQGTGEKSVAANQTSD